MSPHRIATPRSSAVDSNLARFWLGLGLKIRDARSARRWTVDHLARSASLSRWVVYLIERGEPISIDAVARLAQALGLRLEADLVDPRKRDVRTAAQLADPVHSAMGEYEAAHLRRRGHGVGIDEPYQHYQFAGRADVVAWDVEHRALLHIENRTRFPDFQEVAGVYNAKRAYLGAALAQRVGVSRWDSETHVVAGLWSAEVLHLLRLRTESFRSLCPDPVTAFEGWWTGRPPDPGRTSTLIVLDPLAPGRRRPYVGLEAALKADPRYRGYADAASAMMGGHE